MKKETKNALIVTFCLIVPAPAAATFHSVNINEVFPGAPGDRSAQFVELEIEGSGQTALAGKAVTVFDSTGTEIGSYTLPDPSNIAIGDRILVATTEAEDLFTITADVTMTAIIDPSGGKVCFATTVDCVAWGIFAGSGGGSPAASLKLGSSLQRTSARPTDSATDFSFAAPSPANNGGTSATLPYTCGTGTGTPETGEECDTGGSNSDTVVDACRTNCQAAYCGDGVSDTGEECDDGNSNDGDSCRNNCTATSCGDGIVDTGEQCDHGSNNSNTVADACRTNCMNFSCGDGVVDLSESCDDGNATNGDGCNDTCVTESSGDTGGGDGGGGCAALPVVSPLLLGLVLLLRRRRS